MEMIRVATANSMSNCLISSPATATLNKMNAERETSANPLVARRFNSCKSPCKLVYKSHKADFSNTCMVLKTTLCQPEQNTNFNKAGFSKLNLLKAGIDTSLKGV